MDSTLDVNFAALALKTGSSGDENGRRTTMTAVSASPAHRHPPKNYSYQKERNYQIDEKISIISFGYQK